MFNPIDYEVLINERKNQMDYTMRHGWKFRKQPRKPVSFKIS